MNVVKKCLCVLMIGIYKKLLVKDIWRDFMAGFYVIVCAGISLYVYLYGTVDGTE